MAKLYLFLILVILVIVSVSPALADSPQPYQYSLIRCSGLSIDLIISGEQQFDTQYGYTHNLTTDDQWQATYISRANEYAHALGCPQVLNDDGTLSGALSFPARLYAPVFQSIITHGIFP